MLFIPLPGTGTATYDFNGWYDPVNQELHGVSQFAITYNGLLIYADRVDEYVLKKRTAPYAPRDPASRAGDQRL